MNAEAGMNAEQAARRDIIAKAIHESRPGASSWDSLPASPANPQRYYARLAADAVLALFGEEWFPPVSETDKPVSEVAGTVIPEELCGIGGCAFLKHHAGNCTWMGRTAS